jgi:hypothetical protein
MTAGAVEQPSRRELVLFVLLAFAISWAMHIPLALATLKATPAPQPHPRTAARRRTVVWAG